MKRALAWLGMCGALSLALACSKTDGNGPVERGELAARVAQLQCDSLGACCKQQGYVFDAERCNARLSFELEDEFSENGPSAGYDAEAAGKCLNGLSAVCGELEGGDSPSCDRIFPGTLAPGAACRNSDDCRDPENGRAYCELSLTTPDQGVCVLAMPTPHGKLGEPCSFTCSGEDGDDCSSSPGELGAAPPAACFRSEGLYCAFRTSAEQVAAYTCQAVVAIGEPCTDSDACTGDAFCALSGTCTAPRANGEVCDSSSECQSGACNGTCGAARVDAAACALE